MYTTTRKLSILVYMAVAATLLTLGVSTALAASSTHNDIQVSNSTSDEYFPTHITAQTHTHHHSMKLMNSGSANPTSTNDDNSGNGSDDIAAMGWPSDYGSTAGSGDHDSYSATQYGSGNHSHHHHSSTDMTADINGANSTSTAGNGDSYSATQYGSGNHSHPHHSPNDDTIVDIN